MADHGIPPASILPIAESVAKRLRAIASVMVVLAVLFFIGALRMLASPNKYDLSESIAGGAFWVLVLLWINVRVRRKATEVVAAGHRAKTDPSLSWCLRDRLVFAIDGEGAPHPELSFKIRPMHIAMLTVLPGARALK